MVLKNTEATIAYRCPHCGSGILSMVGVFALSGDMIKLKCDCGRSELVMQKTNDDRLRLTVPCMFCPKPHQFVITKTAFFEQELISFPCQMTGLDVCFLGKKEAVMEALDESEKQILDLLKEAGYGDVTSLAEVTGLSDDDADEEDRDVNFTDNHIYDMVLFVVRDLEEEGKIRCRCTEQGDTGDYDIVCDRDRIFVTCKKCGARREIICNGSLATEAFLDADELVLEGMSADT